MNTARTVLVIFFGVFLLVVVAVATFVCWLAWRKQRFLEEQARRADPKNTKVSTTLNSRS